MAFRSASSPDSASSAACRDAASCVTAESIAQYFKSPKCLLAELAFLTTETSLASSVRLCESWTSSRIRSAEEPARIASSRTDRKISLRRIEMFGINRVSQRPVHAQAKRRLAYANRRPSAPHVLAEFRPRGAYGPVFGVLNVSHSRRVSKRVSTRTLNYAMKRALNPYCL